MLENIKSVYFIKFIFSLLEEETKLKIVKYNKSFQNTLNINLLNYILFTGRYFTYEINKNVKEFNYKDDMLKFEGKYLNGKRNGKGKEFHNNGNVKFEGDYLNGKRNGKGKEYYYNNTLIFEGEYLYGKRNGKGKEYYCHEVIKNQILFEGEYLKGEKWNGYIYDIDHKNSYKLKQGKGFIKEYNLKGQIIFEGEYTNGKRNGRGKELNEEGKLIFEGEYLNGKRWNGKGYDPLNNELYELKNGNGNIIEYDFYGMLIYKGWYSKGERNGKGREYSPSLSYKDKLIFEGEYLNGKRNGKGKEYIPYLYRVKYEGEYLNGKRSGKGKEYDFIGKLVFEGEYLYGFRIKGKEYVKGILEFEGDYLAERKWNGKGFDKDGKIIYELINGKGTTKEYNEIGILIYEGEYSDGKRNGKGKEFYFPNEVAFEGEYLNGKRWNGKGREYDIFNQIKFEGEYVNGEKVIKNKKCSVF